MKKREREKYICIDNVKSEKEREGRGEEKGKG